MKLSFFNQTEKQENMINNAIYEVCQITNDTEAFPTTSGKIPERPEFAGELRLLQQKILKTDTTTPAGMDNLHNIIAEGGSLLIEFINKILKENNYSIADFQKKTDGDIYLQFFILKNTHKDIAPVVNNFIQSAITMMNVKNDSNAILIA